MKFDVFLNTGSKAVLLREHAEFRGSPRIGDVISFRDKGEYIVSGTVLWEERENGEFQGTITVVTVSHFVTKQF